MFWSMSIFLAVVLWQVNDSGQFEEVGCCFCVQPHEDGPLYKAHFGILSLQSTLVMDVLHTVQSTADVTTKAPQNEVNSPLLDQERTDKNTPAFSILLQPRSLLVFKDELYTKYLHSIAFRHEDVLDSSVVNLKEAGLSLGTVIRREIRTSLTIRVVNKVLKNVIKI